MPAKNYYEILGVAPSATQEDIKKAYEQLRVKYHPSSNPKNPYAATAKLNELFEAYKILGYPEKREEYDLSLAAEQKVLSDWYSKFTILKELRAYNFLVLKYKVRKIKRKNVTKIGRHGASQWYHVIIWSMVFIAAGFWSVVGFLLGIMTATLIFHKFINNSYYLEEYLKEGKFIKRTDEDTIVFHEQVFEINKKNRKVPDIIGIVVCIIWILSLFMFHVMKGIVHALSFFAFAAGYWWTLAFWEGIKIKKLRDKYKKEFVLETETNDIWIGRE